MQGPNPLLTGTYTVPLMEESKFKELCVPFENVSSALKPILDTHGVAVVTDVATATELAELERAFGRDVAALVDRDELATLPKPELARHAVHQCEEVGPRALPLRTAQSFTEAAGFCLRRCLAHGEFAWAVRRNPRVHQVFAALFPQHAEEALVASLDVPFFSPAGDPPATSNSFSAHVDQNKHDCRPNLGSCDIYQGVLYVWPSDRASGHFSSTVVWPGSHEAVWPLMMQDVSFTESGQSGTHYCELREMSNAGVAARLSRMWLDQARRLCVPAGALLLWNSRTVHTGWRGGPRLAQAVCLEPVSRRSDEDRTAKMRLAALGLPSTHWASAGMQHDMCLGSPGYFASRVQLRHAKPGWLLRDEPAGEGSAGGSAGGAEGREQGAAVAAVNMWVGTDKEAAGGGGGGGAVATGGHDKRLRPSLEGDTKELTEQQQKEYEALCLPLRNLRPLPLRAEADEAKLRQLVRVEYKHTGMWAHIPPGAKQLLEESVREEFKPFL